jgi:hypothetical protein
MKKLERDGRFPIIVIGALWFSLPKMMKNDSMG